MRLLQQLFLQQLQQNQVSVSIFLVNGIKLHGTIEEYNEEVILLKNNATQMIYMHAISTVVPAQAVTLPN